MFPRCMFPSCDSVAIVVATPAPAPGPLAVVYCSDEDIALRAPTDYRALCPAWQSLASGVDGVFTGVSPWLLTSASCDFAAQGVQTGNVVALTKIGAAIGSNALFGIDSVSSSGVTLHRLGQGPGVGQPPSPVGGLSGVTYDVRTFGSMIDDASYDINQAFGINPAIQDRSPGYLTDLRELRQFTALQVLRRAYVAASKEKSDDYALKLALINDHVNEMRGRMTLHWGALGQGDTPSTTSSMRIRR